MDYEVVLRGKPVGKVQMIRQGLYYRVFCQCRLSTPGIYRLYVSLDGQQEKLGVLVPSGSGFGMDTRIPAKRLAGESLRFYITMNGDTEEKRKFVPLSPEEPFTYIDKLQRAFLARQGDTIGLMIPDD